MEATKTPQNPPTSLTAWTSPNNIDPSICQQFIPISSTVETLDELFESDAWNQSFAPFAPNEKTRREKVLRRVYSQNDHHFVGALIETKGVKFGHPEIYICAFMDAKNALRVNRFDVSSMLTNRTTFPLCSIWKNGIAVTPNMRMDRFKRQPQPTSYFMP